MKCFLYLWPQSSAGSMIHDVLIEWAMWSRCGKPFLKYSTCDIPSMSFSTSSGSNMPVCVCVCVCVNVTSGLGWVNRVLRFRREAELWLQVRSQADRPFVAGLTGFCWCGCKWGFPVQTIPHVSSKRNAEAISFRGCWQAPSYCCASSFLRFPCRPLFTSSWLSQGSCSSKTCQFVYLFFLQSSEGHKMLKRLVSKHKLAYLGFNLSRS